eukprot:545064_1
MDAAVVALTKLIDTFSAEQAPNAKNVSHSKNMEEKLVYGYCRQICSSISSTILYECYKLYGRRIKWNKNRSGDNAVFKSDFRVTYEDTKQGLSLADTVVSIGDTVRFKDFEWEITLHEVGGSNIGFVEHPYVPDEGHMNIILGSIAWMEPNEFSINMYDDNKMCRINDVTNKPANQPEVYLDRIPENGDKFLFKVKRNDIFLYWNNKDIYTFKNVPKEIIPAVTPFDAEIDAIVHVD